MGTEDKNIIKRLKKLKRKKYFTTTDAITLGISGRMLSYYTEKKLITRLGQGAYIVTEMQGVDLESIVKETLVQVPRAIICLETALRFHNLTEEASANIHIMVPKHNVPRRKLNGVKIYRVNSKILNIGVIKKNNMKITGIERTIIDMLKFNFPLSKIISVFNETRVKRKQVSFSDLKKMALVFRVNSKFKNFMEAIL